MSINARTSASSFGVATASFSISDFVIPDVICFHSSSVGGVPVIRIPYSSRARLFTTSSDVARLFSVPNPIPTPPANPYAAAHAI